MCLLVDRPPRGLSIPPWSLKSGFPVDSSASSAASVIIAAVSRAAPELRSKGEPAAPDCFRGGETPLALGVVPGAHPKEGRR